MRIHTGITPLLRGSITQRVGAVLNPPARRQLQVFLPAADFVVVFVAVVVFRAIFMLQMAAAPVIDHEFIDVVVVMRWWFSVGEEVVMCGV
ncbi:hypothetical protein MtrunA17_Chr1g0187211 [Medicago truncatula]|uniref:Transmembrane protein, putative n=1 Tax=Medicago truncatula TaxID=3880 RepID=G7I4R5_MEDTR|nr:transmembrane protein, putative [Medicago truncatula]RHN80341.1 hypothetical protein MtrunA17_Chr1g0187211 [Medicago truncatula]